MKTANEKKIYMEATGATGPYEDWWYDELDEDGRYTGRKVNAVDLGEVVEVVWHKELKCWVEAE